MEKRHEREKKSASSACTLSHKERESFFVKRASRTN
jgi:hypothetical protein